MEGAWPERLRTKLYQQPRRAGRGELGCHPIEELSARAGWRSEAVLDQWEAGEGGEGGASVGGRRGWSKRRGLDALIRVARIAIRQRPARQQRTRRRGADSGPRAANGRARHGAGEMTSVNQAPGDGGSSSGPASPELGGGKGGAAEPRMRRVVFASSTCASGGRGGGGRRLRWRAPGWSGGATCEGTELVS